MVALTQKEDIITAINLYCRPSDGSAHGVVGEGAVGARAAGRFRLFRYEVRRWRDGVIPDVAEAVESPQRLITNFLSSFSLVEARPPRSLHEWKRGSLGIT
jgi:hypothetical protein